MARVWFPSQLTGKHTIGLSHENTDLHCTKISVFIALSFLHQLENKLWFSQSHGENSGLLWSQSVIISSHQIINVSVAFGGGIYVFLHTGIFPPWPSNHSVPQERCSNRLFIHCSGREPCINHLLTFFKLVCYNYHLKCFIYLSHFFSNKYASANAHTHPSPVINSAVVFWYFIKIPISCCKSSSYSVSHCMSEANLIKPLKLVYLAIYVD
jgi:hypothetical protein